MFWYKIIAESNDQANQRRPKLFGDDDLSRPPDKEQNSKIQRSSNSSATSSSQEAFQEML
jgi:hypothetical protein